MVKRITRSAKTGQFSGGYRILGKTPDGVEILKPRGGPESFSLEKLKRVIATQSKTSPRLVTARKK